MKMILRWFGEKHDTVTLRQIRQIPGVVGVCTSLLDIPVGEVWPLEEIKALKEQINKEGLTMDVIESVNIHEDIKLGLATRDHYIKNYIETLKNLSEVGVKCLCYNFMPVMDWARSELSKPLEDGSEVMSYVHEEVIKRHPSKMVELFDEQSKGFALPGWEPERLKEMSRLIEAYKEVTEEQYWENMKYFLDAVIPFAEQYDIKMAIHPDDPPWGIFGLNRLITSKENLLKFLSLNPSPYNGLTLCTGSLGANLNNDLPEIIREVGKDGRIHFAHVRNVKHFSERDFDETAHLSSCGSLDMFEIMKAFHDIGFEGYIRPDHGRMIWGEQARPGYGLYDRALGATYLEGIWESLEKMKKLEAK